MLESGLFQFYISFKKYQEKSNQLAYVKNVYTYSHIFCIYQFQLLIKVRTFLLIYSFGNGSITRKTQIRFSKYMDFSTATKKPLNHSQ